MSDCGLITLSILLCLDDQLLKQRFETFQMDIKQSFDAFIQQVGLEEESAKKSWELWESFSSKAAEFPKV